MGDAGGTADTITGAHVQHLGWRNLSPSTIKQRRQILDRLATHAGTAPIWATTGQVLAFLDRPKRDGHPLTPRSRAVELAHLSGFYRWAIIEGLRDDDPTVRVPRPKLARLLPRPISEGDLALAIAEAPDRSRPWFYLAAYAGLRAAEIAGLHGEDLAWHSDPPMIWIRRGKGGDQGTVPMAPILEPVLRPLPRRGVLFVRGDGLPGEVHPSTLSRTANRHLHRLGINETLHSLRHRFGTAVYRASGRDLRQTQELLRHRSIQSTVGYTRVDGSEAIGVLSALPSVASA